MKAKAGTKKERPFEEAMARMAADPAIQAECRSTARDFAIAEADGLKPAQLSSTPPGAKWL